MKLKSLSETPTVGGMKFSTFKLKHGVREALCFNEGGVMKIVSPLFITTVRLNS